MLSQRQILQIGSTTITEVSIIDYYYHWFILELVVVIDFSFNNGNPKHTTKLLHQEKNKTKQPVSELLAPSALCRWLQLPNYIVLLSKILFIYLFIHSLDIVLDRQIVPYSNLEY